MALQHSIVRSPSDPSLDVLCTELAGLTGHLDATDAWPNEQFRLCGDAGVFQWFMPLEWGGQGWSDVDVVQGYLRLSAACLTTTFIITQRTGACQRIVASNNEPLKKKLIDDLVTGRTFATVGISHLTTSRRHLAQPAMTAQETDDGFRLDGFSPWVTGACHAQVIVTGATLPDQRQVLVALPTDLPGVLIPAAPRLVGLSASQTGEVQCREVHVSRDWLLAGPVEDVMRTGVGAGTGGLQTSTLAVGLTSAALDYLEDEARRRPDLVPPAEQLRAEHDDLRSALLAMAMGQSVCSNEQLRARANSLVLRAAQSALAAAKGTGYVVGHPAGRWCREALFFLVWSCPQGVTAAHLCELAGLGDAS
jgi:alkylation response protein AidB-like acyl-CoA dehydrogenase